ncbi:hypothetical protein [Mycolicibacterium baixiangningiae]|nr:hypothetical protein [Mycolicibacterium baixiangningiae]
MTNTQPERSPAIQEWIDRQVALAPPLTNDQRSKLAELLRPARQATTR